MGEFIVTRSIRQEDGKVVFTVACPANDREMFEKAMKALANRVQKEYGVENTSLNVYNDAENHLIWLKYACNVYAPRLIMG
jgi:hypothetical protein